MTEDDVSDLSPAPAGKPKIERAEQQSLDSFASMKVRIGDLTPAQEERLTSWTHDT